MKMQKIFNKMKSIWKDESAQGATEYILILAIVVGIAVVFGPQIKEMLKGKMEEIKGSVAKVGSDN
jgi:Flp pilus assembly pilin Flp